MFSRGRHNEVTQTKLIRKELEQTHRKFFKGQRSTKIFSSFSVAVAGNQIKPGTNKKVTAPLEWNFVAEKQGETKKNIVPSIGPILPGKPQETNSKPKARYVPPDISR